MKKALALLLALICAFSMCTVALAADGEVAEASITVIFKDMDGAVIKRVEVAPGTILTPYAPENPSKEDTDTTRYTFKGWKGEDGVIYQMSTLLTPDGSDAEVVYTADYAEEDISENQTLLGFLASIFERFNKLFEYLAKVFEGIFD